MSLSHLAPYVRISKNKIKEILEKLGYQVQKMTTKHPYDLLINDNVKIDVKVSRCCNNNGFKFYSFNLERKYHNCDINYPIVFTCQKQCAPCDNNKTATETLSDSWFL